MNREKKGRAGSVSSRRDFLRYSAIGGALSLCLPDIIRSEESFGALAHATEVKRFELEEATIAELQAGMKSGKWTARSLAQKYLSRIEEIDKRGPSVNAIIELNPDALMIADALDKERKTKGARGLLHGIPVLIKDNIDTADRMTTTAGSLALSGSIPLKDSFVARRLREAGAVILGKTNLSEWANIR